MKERNPKTPPPPAAPPSDKAELSRWLATDATDPESVRDRMLFTAFERTTHTAYSHKYFTKVKAAVLKQRRLQRRRRMMAWSLVVSIGLSALLFLAVSAYRHNARHQLAFNNRSLSTIIKHIENEFGVTIYLNQSLSNCHLTATFTNYNSAYEILAAIAQIKKLELKQLNNDKFTLHGSTNESTNCQ